MILYQDTSSVVKRYVRDELGIRETRRAVEEADFLVTSLITHAEVRAAFARARRNGRFVNDGEYSHILEDFRSDWRHYAKVNISSSLIRMAGDLAEKHALRAYDAMHLASALVLREKVPDTIAFSTWDDNLGGAAAQEGFQRAH